MWLLFCSLLMAEEPKENLVDADGTIIVEAHRDIEVYVGPIRVIDRTVESSIEAVVDPSAAYTYSGTYWRSAKVSEVENVWIPVTLGERDLKVYGSETIDLVWDNCNYRRQPLRCSVKNDHYFVDTTVYVDDNQLVVKSVLYDSDAQIVSRSTRTNDKIVRWIRQQEITVRQEQMQGGLLGGSGSATTIHKPKEELPLKWEIPHNLTDHLLQQTIMGLWIGVKLPK